MKIYNSRLPRVCFITLHAENFDQSQIQAVLGSLPGPPPRKFPVHKVVRHSGSVAIIAHFMNSPG